MTTCEMYFMGSLIALTLAMLFFINGVRTLQKAEDEQWQRRIQGNDTE